MGAAGLATASLCGRVFIDGKPVFTQCFGLQASLVKLSVKAGLLINCEA